MMCQQDVSQSLTETLPDNRLSILNVTAHKDTRGFIRYNGKIVYDIVDMKQQ